MIRTLVGVAGVRDAVSDAPIEGFAADRVTPSMSQLVIVAMLTPADLAHVSLGSSRKLPVAAFTNTGVHCFEC